MADARIKASHEYEKILAEANAKSDEILEEARQKTAAVAREEKARAKSEIADLISEAAEKMSGSKADEQLYDEFLNDMK